MSKLTALLLGAVVLVQTSFGQDYADIPNDVDFPSPTIELEAMRSAGNLSEQRNHMWRLFSGITRPSGHSTVPVFLTWYGAGEVFAASFDASLPAARSLVQSFSLPSPRKNSRASSGSAPLIVRAHYNRAAYTHIHQNGLQDAARLIAIANSSESTTNNADVDAIPAFPRDAMVVKTVWWPIPDHGVVSLPVWDPASNPPRASGNAYLTWSRMVGVSAGPGFGAGGTKVDVKFLGRSFKQVRAIGVDALYHVTLNRRTAESLMSDPESRRVAGLVLGRPLHANDMLALVALHLATRELTDWVWGTFWWHDQPEHSPFGTPRQPVVLQQPWRNYLMSVSFDTDLPHEPDGSPHVAFNPWLEGRFPDGGHGSGVVSNCMTCHRRASTAADKPFLVTRGSEVVLPTKAADKGVVTTSSLWSLPLQAR